VEDAHVRLACAEALGEFYRDERAARSLVACIGSDRAYGVRAQAVTSMARIRAEEASRVCRDALKQESDRSIVRNAALDGLADLKDPVALDLIRPYCTPGNRRDHRHTAIAAYATLAKELDEESDRRRASEFLIPFLDDWYLRTREATIDALATIGEPSSVTPLRRIASSDPLAAVRERARKAADRVVERAAEASTREGVALDVRDLQRRVKTLEKQLEEVRRAAVPVAPENRE
jgi:HEAT repeat protein